MDTTIRSENKKTSTGKQKNEAVIFTDEFVKERVMNILSATAGLASMLSTVIFKGDECLCSNGPGKAGALSILESMEANMFEAQDILENKPKEE